MGELMYCLGFILGFCCLMILCEIVLGLWLGDIARRIR